MRYAIISDIHANLSALQAVFRDAETHDCRRVVCLGDLVGYGNEHSECVQIVRERAAACVRGNFDDYVSTDVDLSVFNPAVAKSVRQMRPALTSQDAEWLGTLPYVTEYDGFTVVHATLDNPKRWGYVFDKLAAAASFVHQTTPICFFGHTHVPVAFTRDSSVQGGTYSKFKIDPAKKYFINVGAVGQPRDNNPKAAYVIYDTDAGTIELRRLDYDKPGGSDGDVTCGTPVPIIRPPHSAKNLKHN